MNSLFKIIKTRLLICLNYALRLLHRHPNVLSTKVTIQKIINQKLSVSRYGDGEMAVMRGGHNGFQNQNKYLQERLIEIIKSNSPNHAVAIPNVFTKLDHLKKESQEFWKGDLRITLIYWLYFTRKNITYLDTQFTRFYNAYEDKSDCANTIAAIKQIWDQKEVIIVEGSGTRMGYGNDLLANATSIKRIICPSKNAIDSYQQIIDTTLKHTTPNQLILIALDQTATVLAYDLAKQNRWAIDIGHLDIEYEWFLAKANSKIAIKNKDVNEVQSYINEDLNDINYQNQILTTIHAPEKISS